MEIYSNTTTVFFCSSMPAPLLLLFVPQRFSMPSSSPLPLPQSNPPSYTTTSFLYLHRLAILQWRSKCLKICPINAVSYNTIISAYSKCDCSEEALSVFCEMLYCGFRPTNYTLTGLLSCASIELGHGLQLQPLAMKNGLFCADAFVDTALLGLFGRRGLLDEAFRVFNDMACKSLVTWNSMMSLFGRHGLVEDCMLLFVELVRKKVGFSECSFVGVLSGVVCEGQFGFGEQIHDLIINTGFDCKVSVGNSLINMYVKCTDLCLVEKIFENVIGKDIVTWNTIIGPSAKGEKAEKALEFFSKMYEGGIGPNQTTFEIRMHIINSCTSLQIPMHGEALHAKAIISAFETNVYVGSALVDYCAKCSKLDDAHCCFVDIHEKNVVV